MVLLGIDKVTSWTGGFFAKHGFQAGAGLLAGGVLNGADTNPDGFEQAPVAAVELARVDLPGNVWPGENAKSLVKKDASVADTGAYSVEVTSDFGRAVSRDIKVTVALPTNPSLRIQAGNGYMSIVVSGTSGSHCRLESAARLDRPSEWSVFKDAILSSSEEVFIDLVPADRTQRFYRVLTSP